MPMPPVPMRPLGLVAASATAALALSLVPISAGAATLDPVVVDGMNLDSGGDAVVNGVEREEIAPGLVHVSYERMDEQGWQQVNILKAELSPETVRMGYLTPPTVSGDGATVSELVDDAGAIAGVNLDRFDINNSNAPAGWGVQGGEVIKSGNPDAAASVVVDDAGIGHLADLLLAGSADLGDTAVPIGGINVSALGEGVALFTDRWGPFSRDRAIAAEPGVEVVLGADDMVLSVDEVVGEGELDEGTRSLVARRSSPEADALLALEVGDPVDISYSIDSGEIEVQEAGGAWHRLLRDGEIVEDDDGAVNPRTMIGFDEDGDTAYFVQLDGRSAIARGMSFPEQAQFMKDLGAHEAMNADGGGSSQMNVRVPGDAATTIANTPSDGYERHDGDGMGLFLSQPGSGELAGYRLESAAGDDLRVFPDLTRTVNAIGVDESGSSVPTPAERWEVADGDLASVADGVVTGTAPGETVLWAGSGSVEDAADLTVLGPLERITSDQSVINLEAAGSSADISLTGHDAEGFAAPIEARDVEVSNSDPDVISVEPADGGGFTVTAVGDEGAAMLEFAAGGESVQVAVSVPLELRLIDDFSDISGWTTAHDRAPTGGIAPGEGHDGDPSIRLDYDFTESTATRGRYAVAPGAAPEGDAGIDIPGRPQKLSMWVKGDGNGSLLRLQVKQADGVTNWIDGPEGPQSLHVTWEGWERVDFAVPQSFAFPLQLERIRVLETVASKQYAGSLEFSKIYAYLPPDGVEAPATRRVEDPVIVDAGATDASPLRVAVVSDAQFVARDPESHQVAGARDALREIAAADPDVMLINGDFVDEGSAEDFELARRILDEELADADFPWYYVPGNHEVMGASIDNFVDAFGDHYRSVDVEGTRIITLDSATGTLGDVFPQMQMLRERLDDAAEDPAVTGVLVFSHMPSNDPLPTAQSQLSDRNEAALLDDWMQDFRSESGKSIALVSGHIGAFDASSSEGVPTVIGGNSGKGPASTPGAGGFTGWTMLGVDPAQGEWAEADGRWLSAETRPRVDEGGLEIEAPTTLAVGEDGDVSGLFAQDYAFEGRDVPVAWPVSHRWGGDGVHVGAAGDAPSDATVAIDPDTRRITALRAGVAELELTVNDATATVEIEVEGGAGEEPGDDSGAEDAGEGSAEDAGADEPAAEDGDAETGEAGESADAGAGDDAGEPGSADDGAGAGEGSAEDAGADEPGTEAGGGQEPGDASDDGASDDDLAATGAEQSIAPIVLAALMVAGGILLVVSRRRAARR
ncbi:phosphodiester glycosidase family protein [Microbacterium sp. gxy059]|uniref:phosphodiester glycosidase family protein n=1 Tax=Microbacterium sp. gxy059 TaxID=2957199 RepID=UPI003D96845F